MMAIAMKVVALEVRMVDAKSRQQQRLVAILEDWANWCHRGHERLGYPTRSASCGGAGANSFDDMCEQVDTQVSQLVDAAVSDLSPMDRAAIYCEYGLARVFRFPRSNYDAVLSAAHAALMIGLRRKGVDFT